ncbi:DUF1761 domain-containing protein [Candidatus Woesearchaeota archaeon]|nr:DUF1761 domain-containing protein [Candidatus Woesearchaeota archaeon]
MVDYLGIVLATLASYALGALWHSPLMFGNAWARLSGMDKKIKKVSKSSMNLAYGGTLVTTLLTAFVLSLFLEKITLFGEGLFLAFAIWFGFYATSQLGMVLWEQKSFKLFLINSGHSLVALLVMAAVIIAV